MLDCCLCRPISRVSHQEWNGFNLPMLRLNRAHAQIFLVFCVSALEVEGWVKKKNKLQLRCWRCYSHSLLEVLWKTNQWNGALLAWVEKNTINSIRPSTKKHKAFVDNVADSRIVHMLKLTHYIAHKKFPQKLIRQHNVCIPSAPAIWVESWAIHQQNSNATSCTVFIITFSPILCLLENSPFKTIRQMLQNNFKLAVLYYIPCDHNSKRTKTLEQLYNLALLRGMYIGTWRPTKSRVSFFKFNRRVF